MSDPKKTIEGMLSKLAGKPDQEGPVAVPGEACPTCGQDVPEPDDSDDEDPAFS